MDRNVRTDIHCDGCKHLEGDYCRFYRAKMHKLVIKIARPAVCIHQGAKEAKVEDGKA